MPAAMRGGSRRSADPRAKRPAGPKTPKGQPRAAAGYAPAKLAAAQGIGLKPKHALGVAGGVLALALAAVLATGDRAEALGHAAGDGVGRQFAAAGFALAHVHVEGASPRARADILRATGLALGQPLVGLDLDDLRARIETVGWVKEARVVRLMPDTLMIHVVERSQLAVWQNNGRLQVIDGRGQPIAGADPARFPELPLIVGAGANHAAAAILPAIEQRPRLADRVVALVRVDTRRWDVRLKDGSLVQLPATGEEAALIRLDKLDQATRILELGFERIDLRDPEMVAVRPRDGALPGELVDGGA